jgi:hypothetical protein
LRENTSRPTPVRRLILADLHGRLDALALIPAENQLTALELIGNDLDLRALRKPPLVALGRVPPAPFVGPGRATKDPAELRRAMVFPIILSDPRRLPD